MGTGRSGLAKGIRDKSGHSAIQSLRIKSRSTGYELIGTEQSLGPYEKYLNRYIDELARFQRAMKETEDIINSAGGSVSIAKLAMDTLGNTDANGVVTLNSLRIQDINALLDTLPHEHTHNLVSSLIVKELGFERGSYEHYAAFGDGIIEHSINTEALEKYKKYMRRQYDRQIKEAQSEFAKTDPKYHDMLRFGIDGATRDKMKLDTLTIADASKASGMRSYARHQYTRAPKGHYIEMPTVAAEKLVSSGYSFKKLLETSPYSYFVLQTTYHRLHKGKNKKK